SWFGRCPRPVVLRLHNADLAQYGQQSLQGLRIASTHPLRLMAMSQKSIHNTAIIQILDNNLFLFQPPAEIGNYDDLRSSDRLYAPAAADGDVAEIDSQHCYHPDPGQQSVSVSATG